MGKGAICLFWDLLLLRLQAAIRVRKLVKPHCHSYLTIESRVGDDDDGGKALI